MPKWLSVVLILVFLASMSQSWAQDELVLVPLRDEAFEIQGLVPEGWEEISRGVYARGAEGGDRTLVAMQANPGSAESLFELIAPQLGLEEIPEPVEEYTNPALSWTLYQFETTVTGLDFAFDLAVAAADQRTYLLLLQTTPSEYESLHTDVFLPMLEAFVPLVVETEDLPYLVEEVTFPNGDVTLAGTLTLPEGEGTFPAIVLVSGSGKQDRDETLLPLAEIRPFRLLADYLTQQGYIVLRYDDQGVGGSTGEVDTTLQENAADAEAALNYLLSRPEVNPDQLGILGHSEGGTIAALLGATNPDLDFIISMAGTTVNGVELLYKQNERLLLAEGATPEQLEQQLAFLDEFFPAVAANDTEAMEIALETQMRQQIESMTPEEQATLGDIETIISDRVAQNLAQYTSRWFRSFLEYDPNVDWQHITIPVLAIFGELDVQVDAEQNSTALETALTQAGNTNYTIVVLEDANHLFQAAQTGAMSEYGTLESVFVPTFLPTIGDWLAELFAE